MRLQARRRLGALAVVTVMLATACRRQGPAAVDPVADAVRANPQTLSGPSAQEGRRLFAAYCAPCHGEDGRGDGQNASRLAPRPPDLRSPGRARPPVDRRRVVEWGSASVGRSPLCPPRARDLRPAQIDALVGYLRQLGGGGAAPN